MPRNPTTHSGIAEGYAHLRRSQMRPTHSGIAEVYARERRRQMRTGVYFRRCLLYLVATWRLLLREWRRLAALRQLKPLLRVVVWRCWRLEAAVRKRAMLLVRRWRRDRMVRARRGERVLIRRSLEEWRTNMLVYRSMRNEVLWIAHNQHPYGARRRVAVVPTDTWPYHMGFVWYDRQ